MVNSLIKRFWYAYADKDCKKPEYMAIIAGLLDIGQSFASVDKLLRTLSKSDSIQMQTQTFNSPAAFLYLKKYIIPMIRSFYNLDEGYFTEGEHDLFKLKVFEALAGMRLPEGADSKNYAITAYFEKKVRDAGNGIIEFFIEKEPEQILKDAKYVARSTTIGYYDLYSKTRINNFKTALVAGKRANKSTVFYRKGRHHYRMTKETLMKFARHYPVYLILYLS